MAERRPNSGKLNEFIQTVKSEGLARTNRFAFNFSLPQMLLSGTNPYMENSRLSSMLVENVQLPGVNLNTIQNRTFGEFRETPYETMYDNINVTFYVDRQMKIKHLFDAWILGVQGYDTSNPGNGTGTRQFRYYKEYITDVTIWVYDTLGQSYYAVNLYECYPKTLSAITLDNNAKDIMKLNVTFQYKYWRPGKISNRSSIVPYDATREANPLPTGPQPVEQVSMWEDAWNDVNEWLGTDYEYPLSNFDMDIGSMLRF